MTAPVVICCGRAFGCERNCKTTIFTTGSTQLPGSGANSLGKMSVVTVYGGQRREAFVADHGVNERPDETFRHVQAAKIVSNAVAHRSVYRRVSRPQQSS